MAELDFHDYHPRTILGSELIETGIRQAWEMGERTLTLIHGHSRYHAVRRPFANTNTGWLGLTIRHILRHGQSLREFMFAKIDCSHNGSTTIRLRENPSPSRTAFNFEALPERDYR
jgi:hypothetical protein